MIGKLVRIIPESTSASVIHNVDPKGPFLVTRKWVKGDQLYGSGIVEIYMIFGKAYQPSLYAKPWENSTKFANVFESDLEEII